MNSNNVAPLAPNSACLSICSPSEPGELNSQICNFEDLSGANPIMGEHLRRYLPLLRGQEDLVMVFNFLPLEFSTYPKCFFFTRSPVAEAKRFILH